MKWKRRQTEKEDEGKEMEWNATKGMGKQTKTRRAEGRTMTVEMNIDERKWKEGKARHNRSRQSN